MDRASAGPVNFGHALGFKIDEWGDGHGKVSLVLERWHLNASKIVHGGVIMTLLDVATGMAGLFCTVKGNRRYSVTVSLNTNFIGQARTGKIFATGSRTASGRNLFFASAEVRSEEGVLLATATAVHRYRRGSENPEGVPKGS